MSDLTLLSLYEEPRCTILVRPDGQVYFQMKTVKGRTTVVRGPSGGNAKEGSEAGWIELEPKGIINVGSGGPKDLSTFLRRTSDTTRMFTGPFGGEYTWKSSSNGNLELQNESSRSPSQPSSLSVRTF